MVKKLAHVDLSIYADNHYRLSNQPNLCSVMCRTTIQLHPHVMHTIQWHIFKDMIIHFLENSKMQLKSTDLVKNTVLLSYHCLQACSYIAFELILKSNCSCHVWISSCPYMIIMHIKNSSSRKRLFISPQYFRWQ